MRTRVAAVLFRGPSVLLIERFFNSQTYFVLPGGGLEKGEDPAACAVREVAEETSLECRVVRELAAFDMPEQNQRHQIFLCEITGGDPDRLAFAEGTNEMAAANAQNSFAPRWIPAAELADVQVFPIGTREAILSALS